MKPDKVVITITANGDKTEVLEGDKIISSRDSTMISINESKYNQKGDIFDDFKGHDHLFDLADAIDQASLEIFDIACELKILNKSF